MLQAHQVVGGWGNAASAAALHMRVLSIQSNASASPHPAAQACVERLEALAAQATSETEGALKAGLVAELEQQLAGTREEAGRNLQVRALLSLALFSTSRHMLSPLHCHPHPCYCPPPPSLTLGRH
jgi:hypothetical protein